MDIGNWSIASINSSLVSTNVGVEILVWRLYTHDDSGASCPGGQLACDDPRVLGAVHLLLVRLTEDHTRLVLVEVADNYPHAVALKEHNRKGYHRHMHEANCRL